MVVFVVDVKPLCPNLEKRVRKLLYIRFIQKILHDSFLLVKIYYIFGKVQFQRSDTTTRRDYAH